MTSLAELIDDLRQHGSVPREQSSIPDGELLQLGISVSERQLRWPEHCAPLSAADIVGQLQELSPGQLPQPVVLPAVGSTNDWLREQAVEHSVHWQAVTAECQTAGKGRRGRQWSTPIGGGVALSVAIKMALSAQALAGLPLVVGLAVVEALDPNGRFGLTLKWPNDVNVGDSKLGGILVELLQSSGAEATVVVGIGLNYRLPAQVVQNIDKNTVDLATLGAPYSRNQIIARLLDQLWLFCRRFEAQGFAPFQEAFDQVHGYQGRACQIIGVDKEPVDGCVEGVSSGGELLLRTSSGLRSFNAGEVSLRPTTVAD